MRMQVRPSKSHGVLDRVAGPALAATPNMLRRKSSRRNRTRWLFAGLAAAGIVAAGAAAARMLFDDE